MAAQAIAAALGAGFQMADSIFGSKQKAKLAEKSGFQDTTSRMLQLRQQREAQKQASIEQHNKTKRTAIIVLSSVIGLVLIVLIIFLLKKQ